MTWIEINPNTRTAGTTIEKDKWGNEFKHIWFGELNTYTTNAVTCWNGVNSEFRGMPQFIERINDAEYSDKIILQFLIKDLNKVYESKSAGNYIEIYMHKRQLIETLERLLNELKK